MKSLPLAVLFVIPVVSGFSSAVHEQHASIFSSNPNGEVPLLIYFKSSDCTTCDPFDQLFDQVNNRTRIEQHYNAVCLNIDQSEGQICAEIYDVTSIPTLVIADRTGHVMFRSTTTLTAEEIKMILETLPGGSPDSHQDSPDVTDTEVITHVDTGSEFSETESAKTHGQCARNTGLALRSEHYGPVLTATSDLSAGMDVDLAISKYRKPILVSHQVVTKEEPAPSPVELPEMQSPEVPANEEPVVTESAGEPVSSPKATTRKWTYSIQLGYFSTNHNALKLVRKASSSGLPEVRTESSQRNGQEFFRVISGTYKSLQEAQKHLDSAISMGYKAAIHRW